MATVLFDVDSIRARIINRLRSKISWQNVLDTSEARALIDPFAEEEQYLANYDTYLTRENKWTLARNKTSLLAMTDLHRYNVHRFIGAKGVVTLSSDQTFAAVPVKTIPIPKYSQFSTDSGINVVTYTGNTAITTSDTSIDVDVIQGILKTYTYVATGTDFEEITLNVTNIDNDVYELYVNGILWNKINNIYEASLSDLSYELTNKIDFSGIYIKFGNNINGKKLEYGDTIEFKYIETLGLNGNISTSNTVTTVNSVILDIDGNAVTIYAKNDDAIVGGQNIEDIESIRKNAPLFFQTGDRASNYIDYEQIVLDNFSYILKIVVWGVFENVIDKGYNPWSVIDPNVDTAVIAIINDNVHYPTATSKATAIKAVYDLDYFSLEDNNVFLAALRVDLVESLSTSEKNDIATKLNNYKAPTDIVIFYDCEIVNILFNVNAYVSDKSYTLNEVKNNINDQLKLLYDVQNRDFYSHIRFSDYQRAVDEVEGVDYHHTTVSFYKDYPFSINFTTDLDIPIYPLTPSSISVYLDEYAVNILNVDGTLNKSLISTLTPVSTNLIGSDNGLGSIVGTLGYTLTGSNIDYNTGLGAVVVLTVLPATYNKYRVRIYYNIVSDDLLLRKRYQIFGYDEITNTSRIIVNYE